MNQRVWRNCGGGGVRLPPPILIELISNRVPEIILRNYPIYPDRGKPSAIPPDNRLCFSFFSFSPSSFAGAAIVARSWEIAWRSGSRNERNNGCNREEISNDDDEWNIYFRTRVAFPKSRDARVPAICFSLSLCVFFFYFPFLLSATSSFFFSLVSRRWTFDFEQRDSPDKD